MSIKDSAGLQDSGTDASKENRTRQISELIEQHENTDWSEIPGISAAEAGAWTARLTVKEGL